MKSNLGTIASTVLLVAGLATWPGYTPAAEVAETSAAADPRSETRAQAQDAARAAANDAVNRMRAATQLDLNVELPGRTSAMTAGD